MLKNALIISAKSLTSFPPGYTMVSYANSSPLYSVLEPLQNLLYRGCYKYLWLEDSADTELSVVATNQRFRSVTKN
jgi:hypothetical protein